MLKTYVVTMYKVTEEIKIKVRAKDRLHAEYEARERFKNRKRGWKVSSISRLYRVEEGE